MPICVQSEIGPLKKVLLHRPGKELEYLVPGELERLLFDDIPYLAVARREHDTFARLLREQGAEVVYLEDLMAQTLRAVPGLRETFVRQFLAESGSTAGRYADELYEMLMAERDDLALVERTMTGISASDLPENEDKSPLVSLAKNRRRYILDPIPNLYFTRDPFACIGRGVSLNSMYSATRRRETIYGQYILAHHPDFAGKVPMYFDREYPFSIEGGDIFNLSDRVLAVGISQRTTPEAVEVLASRIFADESSPIRHVLALDIPSLRVFMHLDTVLTQVDYDKFTVHPEILDDLHVYHVTPGAKGTLRVREHKEPLETVLAEALGRERITLIRCGGRDSIASEREQWNDGSNTLCLAPGKIVVYDRNYVTNEILRSHGLEVFEMPSSELSRGRGGPRCMSMPLQRLPLEGSN